VAPFSIGAGETQEMTIGLDNPDMDVTLVQFDLTLPEGLSIAKEDDEYVVDIARTTWKKHGLNYNELDGYIRFLLASQSNALLTGNTGAIITMQIVAEETFHKGIIVLQNIEIVAPDATAVHPNKVTVTVNPPDSIQSVTMDKDSQKVYNLQGMEVLGKDSQKGIYIVNGKKVVRN